MSHFEVNDLSASENTAGISHSSKDDSGIQTFFYGKNEARYQDNSQASCSDLLSELFQCHKRLREAETQVTSLSFILEQGQADDATMKINHAVFRENKNSLEEKIVEIKKQIVDKASVLQNKDVKLHEYYLQTVKNETNNNLSKEECSFDEERIKEESTDQKHSHTERCSSENMDSETSGCELENKRAESEQYFEPSSFDKEYEIIKLRRVLTETKQKHKEERDNVMEQLKSLQITTVQDVTDWNCVIKEKQTKIDELTKQNSELQNEYAQVSQSWKNCEKVRQKEGKEAEKTKRKNEKVILSLRKQNTSINERMKVLVSESEELKKVEKELRERIKYLNERNEEIEKELLGKTQRLNEQNNLVQEYSNEIKETNILMNNLVMEITRLNNDRENLNKQLKERKAENKNSSEHTKIGKFDEEQLNCVDSSENKCFVHVGTQADDEMSTLKNELETLTADCQLKRKENLDLTKQLQKQEILVEHLREIQVKLEKDCDTWKNKSLNNER